MISIKKLEAGSDFRYQADVSLDNHSYQAAYFNTRDTAEQWANRLQRRIGTNAIFKGIKGS